MLKIQILLCKIIGFFLRLLGRGTNFPGELALKLNRNILFSFKLPSITIAVTGSAGKGSTSTIIADTLRLSNKKVVHNRYGSNMTPGIVSLLIENCKLDGTIKADALVIEVDERYTKTIFSALKPQYVVVTNICRDQPPRHGNFDLVFDKIKDAINGDMTLVLNGDDPYLQKFNLDDKYNVIYYGINKSNCSYKKNKFDNINMYYCPKCLNKLNYEYYHIESLGDYYCTNCDFKRPNINYLATSIDLDKSNMVINKTCKITIAFNVLYYAYNILSAYSICALIGLDEKEICNHISNMQNNTKLNNSYKWGNRNVYVMNNKAENSTTFNESVLFASNKKVKKVIVIGWKEISRRYEFNDISWLYDIKFELLNDKFIDKIICVGPQKYDIAVRMKYAGFKEKNIKVYDTLDYAKNMIKKDSKGDIFAILNFDYVKPFNDIMKED